MRTKNSFERTEEAKIAEEIRQVKDILADFDKAKTTVEQEQYILRALDVGTLWLHGKNIDGEWVKGDDALKEKIKNRKILGPPSEGFASQVHDKLVTLGETLWFAGADAEQFVEPLYRKLLSHEKSESSPKGHGGISIEWGEPIGRMVRASILNTIGEKSMLKSVLLGLFRMFGTSSPEDLSARKTIFDELNSRRSYYEDLHRIGKEVFDELCVENPALVEEALQFDKLQLKIKRDYEKSEAKRKKDAASSEAFKRDNTQGLKDFKNNPFAEQLSKFKPK